MKEIASHFGGTRNGMVVAWPGHVADPGGLRSQFQYVTDIAPTIYQATGIAFPDRVYGVEQTPLSGSSLMSTFAQPHAQSSHPVQYFEINSNRAIYDHGWVAAARHNVPWDFNSSAHDPSTDRWELYHVAEDFSEAHDVAQRFPEKLAELKQKFDEEARRNNVYPLAVYDTRALLAGDFRKPSPADGKHEFHFFADQERIPNYVLPALQRRAHTLEAKVLIPPGGAQGVLLAAGSRDAGFAWFIQDGRVIYDSNVGGQHDVIASSATLPTDKSVVLKFDYQPKAEGGGAARLYVNGTEVGSATFKRFAGIPSNEYLEIGEQSQSPTSRYYEAPFRFTGKIERLRLDLK